MAQKDRKDPQAAYKAHLAYAKEHPDHMAAALSAVNKWEAAESTLAHAVAVALASCYEAGRQRLPFPAPAPKESSQEPAKVIRRARRQ